MGDGTLFFGVGYLYLRIVSFMVMTNDPTGLVTIAGPLGTATTIRNAGGFLCFVIPTVAESCAEGSLGTTHEGI